MLAFSPDGRLLTVVGIDGIIRFYRVPGFSLLTAFKELDSASSLAFSPNGRELAIGDSDGNVYVNSLPATYTHLNFSSTQPFTSTIPAQSIATHWGLISAISYSRPLGLLATGSPSGARVWDTNPARVAANICKTLKAPVRKVQWTEYLPDIPYNPVCS